MARPSNPQNQHLQRGHQWKPLHYLGISIGHPLEALGTYSLPGPRVCFKFYSHAGRREAFCTSECSRPGASRQSSWLSRTEVVGCSSDRFVAVDGEGSGIDFSEFQLIGGTDAAVALAGWKFKFRRCGIQVVLLHTFAYVCIRCARCTHSNPSRHQHQMRLLVYICSQRTCILISRYVKGQTVKRSAFGMGPSLTPPLLLSSCVFRVLFFASMRQF